MYIFTFLHVVSLFCVLPRSLASSFFSPFLTNMQMFSTPPSHSVKEVFEVFSKFTAWEIDQQ